MSDLVGNPEHRFPHYMAQFQVKFNKINTGHDSLPEEFSPTRYKSNTNQALFINIVDKTTEVGDL